jgi:hypothetical protein
MPNTNPIGVDAAEALAQHIDTLDNLAGALKLPMPANMHVAALREQLPALVHSMRTDFAAATGNNPWDTHHDQ